MKQPIPQAALSKHIGFLGINGSGKTSVCKSAVVEPALEAGERVLVIDPTGVWWGLRISATGKSKGFPIYIFGGDHGDYPLRAKDAVALAEAFGTSSDSAVFDTSQMTVTERTLFFTAFAETLLRKNKGPVKLVIDEAHLFMPQSGARGGGLVPDMLHAGNNLVSLGRSKGLRISLISQRPAKLHKDSLTQVHSLVAMRLIAPQDRAAVKDWIGDQADATSGDRIIATLPSLSPGEAYVWAPAEHYLERVKFDRPRTFDSSAAPDEGDGTGPALAPINLDALKGKLATIDAEKKANDPALLRKEIADLKAQVAKGGAPDPEAIRSSYLTGFNDGKEAVKNALAPKIRDAAVNIEALLSYANPQPAAKMAAQWTPAEIARFDQKKPPIVLNRIAPRPAGDAQEPGDDAMPPGERACMTVIAQHPNGVTNAAFSVVTGYKRSTRNLYKQRLRAKGYITEQGDRITATPAGVAALGSFEPLPTGEALQRHVLATLPDGERKILAYLIECHPQPASGETIDETTGYKRSSRNLYLQRLRARELVESDRDSHQASPNLFG